MSASEARMTALAATISGANERKDDRESSPSSSELLEEFLPAPSGLLEWNNALGLGVAVEASELSASDSTLTGGLRAPHPARRRRGGERLQ
jgi:hypothetical protein